MAKPNPIFPFFTEQQKQRFWAKVLISDPEKCWPWQGVISPQGYGVYSIRRKDQRRNIRANRLAFFFHTGVNPEDFYVCHSCDNPKCCNPHHLFLGSAADNSLDMIKKGRAASGDKNGARIYPERLARGERNGRRLHPESYPSLSPTVYNPECRAKGDRNGMRTHPESVQRGESHVLAKLTEEDVRAILREYKEDQTTYKKLAAKYGVSDQKVYQIIKGKAWPHVYQTESSNSADGISSNGKLS